MFLKGNNFKYEVENTHWVFVSCKIDLYVTMYTKFEPFKRGGSKALFTRVAQITLCMWNRTDWLINLSFYILNE